jgi:hypothetical protein
MSRGYSHRTEPGFVDQEDEHYRVRLPLAPPRLRSVDALAAEHIDFVDGEIRRTECLYQQLAAA